MLIVSKNLKEMPERANAPVPSPEVRESGGGKRTNNQMRKSSHYLLPGDLDSVLCFAATLIAANEAKNEANLNAVGGKFVPGFFTVSMMPGQPFAVVGKLAERTNR